MNKIGVVSIMVFLLILSGCNQSQEPLVDEDTSTWVAEVDQKCVDLATELDKKCTEKNISNLDLETLEQCDWITQDREDFTQYCNDPFGLYDVSSTYKFSSGWSWGSKAEENIYSGEINKICNNTKMGGLTLKELDFCIDKFHYYSFCKSE